MKIYGTSLLFLILLSSFRAPTVEVNMTGHLHSKSHRSVGGITIFVKGAVDNGSGTAVTDSNGDFNLMFDDSFHNTKPLLFYYVGEHGDTVLLKRVSKFKSDTPEMTFWIK
jgi:hypothetical protein